MANQIIRGTLSSLTLPRSINRQKARVMAVITRLTCICCVWVNFVDNLFYDKRDQLFSG